MSSRALLLILGVLLLLLSLAQGGIRRKKPAYEVERGTPVIKACERKPKLYLCQRHCEADEDCQANNICCSTTCGNVCVNLLDDSVWEEPPARPDFYPEGQSFSQVMFDKIVFPPTAASNHIQ
ncbi:WAP four-disulfide core domain protein 10A isoform X3 [Meriones unguiculatus]|uniref:WAP four-disulfide core domain protein 10A isoform X3 n=1 Tax=Meriones unguiculatus TaxID=10047 RepID=UPI000B4EC5C5|nr:WAP four-disulfide core domain protein 10A-like isoform X1 [Meriones unguiculatus]XP_021518947.1 WAP four-disulfide core domain protein 10A-like isoform X1 [Meriones unguiculatus]XP_021518954.1 WAP four-disulfide core domain protein 10A isoform X3 [Meriones unguiculatus]